MAANDPARYADVLDEQAGIRVWHSRGLDVRRPRERVVACLMEEWTGWPDASLEPLSLVAEGQCAAVEFRIQATENERYVEHNRTAILQVRDGKVQTIDLYCPEPVPSAHRGAWIAPATLSESELNHIFESFQYAFDAREWIPPNASWTGGLRGGRNGSGDAHPGSNGVGGVRWSEAEADRRIAEMIEYHRERNIGFQWFVGPFDTPRDLCERLERHGMRLAGDQVFMARIGLEPSDIPANPMAEVEVIDGTNDASIEASLQIIARSFNWTPEQIDERRQGFFERLRNPRVKDKVIGYLARLGGVPAAAAALVLRGGIAYLGGAATLPEYRNQKLYSTLLLQRLADAHARGYHIAALHAGPMSRRVVSRYRFKEYARFHLYGWMPEMDEKVIKSLVPDE